MCLPGVGPSHGLVTWYVDAAVQPLAAVKYLPQDAAEHAFIRPHFKCNTLSTLREA